METQNINNFSTIQTPAQGAHSPGNVAAPLAFQKILQQNLEQYFQARSGEPTDPPPADLAPPHPAAGHAGAVSAYQKQQKLAGEPKNSAWETYKDEQLLSNPGGDEYSHGEKINQQKRPGFFARIGKNIADAAGNVKNFFSNLLMGAKTYYRDENGQVQATRRKGLVRSAMDFVKDIGSALSFGAWRPDGEAPPRGPGESIKFAFGKLKEAFVGDLVDGIGGTVNQLGEDLVLAGLNLVEVLPDATIGNLPAGEKLVTKIFDNGQVAIDYLTDVAPLGEAWLRVHAMSLEERKAPILYNLKMPEYYDGDERWQHIRNTTFRKRIETAGALLADIVTLNLLGTFQFGSEKRH